MISETLDALKTLDFLARYIKFPIVQEEIQQKQADFTEFDNFPGVVGAIDGTHIRILAPREYEQEYVNRKNYHSINIQLVFDAQYRILDVVAQWPGSVHDSRIWNECGLPGKASFSNFVTSFHAPCLSRKVNSGLNFPFIIFFLSSISCSRSTSSLAQLAVLLRVMF